MSQSKKVPNFSDMGWFVSRNAFEYLNVEFYILIDHKQAESTWEHREDSSKGVELEPINYVAGVDQLHAHEAEAHHQQQNVQHLRNHR